MLLFKNKVMQIICEIVILCKLQINFLNFSEEDNKLINKLVNKLINEIFMIFFHNHIFRVSHLHFFFITLILYYDIYNNLIFFN